MRTMLAGIFGAIQLISFSCVNWNLPNQTIGGHMVENTGAFRSIEYKIGSGWTRSYRTITVDSSKNMVVIENGGVIDSTDDTLINRISSNQYDSLIALIDSINVRDLPKQFVCEGNCPTDLPVITLTFTMDGYAQSVSIQTGATIPEKLTILIRLLDSWSDNLNNDQ